jgi:hypothetical protein
LIFDDCYEQIDGDGNPDLGLDRLVARAIKGLDSKMLLDLFEE